MLYVMIELWKQEVMEQNVARGIVVLKMTLKWPEICNMHSFWRKQLGFESSSGLYPNLCRKLVPRVKLTGSRATHLHSAKFTTFFPGISN